MDNFDLKKYLIENKATTNSRMLSEGTENVYTISDNIADMFKMDVVKLKKEADTKYGFSKYKEGSDYKWAIGRGDDFPNALVIHNLKMVQDPQVKKFVAWVEEDEENITEKKHSKMVNENAGTFFADFKSKFANYIQEYEEVGLDEEVNVVDSNMGIDKWYRYPKTSVLVNHAVKSLQAAGVDNIEKLYAKNNLKYAGESLNEFFQNLEVNETYTGVDFTLIPGVDFSFAEVV